MGFDFEMLVWFIEQCQKSDSDFQKAPIIRVDAKNLISH